MVYPGLFSWLRSFFLVTALLIITGCSTSSSLQQPVSSNPTLYSEVFYNQKVPEDEGMWLLPQIHGSVYNELKSKGLQLPPRALYHPDSASINQSIVRINIGQNTGGTGSFVSEKGLILTNHHVASNAIAGASTTKDNYLNKGFYAGSVDKEIPLENYSLYIPVEQQEVTSKINRRLADTLTYREEQQLSGEIRRQLVAQRKGSNKNIKVVINDFWAGNRQFMSVYKVIRDVRLVHAPPESIGNYGGNTDNWQWPRHTGDYAFLRAYVGKDGAGRPYARSNVPFQPEKHLTVTAEGINPGDFTMTLGFPGNTYRHESSYALNFYQKYRNPVLIKSYKAILGALEYAARQDKERALDTASQRAAFANNIKYYQGVQRGFKKHHVLDQKRAIEKKFSKWIERDSLRNIKYRRVLEQLDQAFNIASQTGDLLFATFNTLNHSKLIQIAGLYNSYEQYLSDSTKSDLSRTHKDSLLNRHRHILSSINIEAQKMMLTDMLYILSTLPEGKVMFHLMRLFGNAQADSLKTEIRKYLDEQQQKSVIFSVERGRKYLSLPIDSARKSSTDPMVKLYQEILETYRFSRKNYLQHLAYLRPARERYVEGMLAFRNDSTGYADANSTLRLSGGRIYGYSPKDGVYNMPFTTFDGMLAKDTDKKPFDAPKKLEAYRDSSATPLFTSHPPTAPDGASIVNFLSTNDITGGNSGSPLLNGSGELVGLAFDSNIEGAISDYLYDARLSRTISVDIRYILFLMKEFTGADRLLKEMDISQSSPQAADRNSAPG